MPDFWVFDIREFYLLTGLLVVEVDSSNSWVLVTSVLGSSSNSALAIFWVVIVLF
ncbi:hypothetical protein BVRB_5g117450 [Beta vulgaris subsp. vulgaris]|nr:hypothetical protein BVRB_5g117450 [Beta vulgaris subsp. vulgaris]